ncbi:hypothetical protein [Nocardia sp. NPDC047038]|uniref:hypothetical protein n=1 Tax=Nocardia sp. NPDC047038 TaxID=3154338 RepID=UPI0033C8991A
MDTAVCMGETAFDDLEFARQQLHFAAQELTGSDMTPQVQVQLGLLVAQVAVADRLSALLLR